MHIMVGRHRIGAYVWYLILTYVLLLFVRGIYENNNYYYH